MGSIRVSRPAVLAQAIAIALVFCGNAVAQPFQQEVNAPTTATTKPSVVTVKIAAQPLKSALDAFAAQTGLQVVYSSSVQMRGLQSPGFAGTLPAGEILSRLLASSGLVFKFVNSHTVAVHARTTAAPASAATAAPQPRRAAKKIAAEPAPTATDKSTTQLDTVEVLGTNLRDISVAAPVQIIDAEMIEERGYSSIEDVLRDLPQNFSSMTSAATALGETEYGDTHLNTSTLGSSGINLLGLGSRSTLVLVDGKRRTGSAQAQGDFTDISSIPLAEIERIEVLGAGASAIYGADAVAGVVNIVLKKSYEGTVVQARHEYSASGADASRVDLAHTFGWTNGRLTASAEFRESDPPNIRRYIHVGPAGIGDFSDIGGVDERTPNLGQPGVVFQSINGGFPGFPFYPMKGAPLGVIPSGQNGTALQPSELLPYNAATAPSIYPVARIGPQVKNPSLRLSGEQTFDNDLKLSYGVGYAQQRDTEYWHPTPSNFGFLVGPLLTYVPASNPYNHFGQDVLVGYSYAREFAGMTFSQDQKQTNTDYNVGLSGKLPFVKNWTFDLTYNGSKEKGRSDSLGDFYGAYGPQGYARIQPVVDGLNVFGDGNDPAVVASNRALLDTLVGSYANTFNSSANTLELLTRGALFSLPAGKVEAAIGAQYDTQHYNYESTFGGLEVSDSKRDDTAVFAEMGLPLLKDLPWVKELTLTLAARHGSFSQSGTSSLENFAYNYTANADLLALGGFDLQKLTGVTAPATSATNSVTAGTQMPVSHTYANTSTQVGLVWVPMPSLRLHATWGQSFLTPSSSQQFGLVQATDWSEAVVPNGGQLPAGYPYVVQLTGPNPDLKPQVATVKTIGFDYMPGFARGLTVSATYNDTSFKNYIGDPLSNLSIPQIFSNINNLPASVFIKGNNGVLLWDDRQVNFLGRVSRSVDITASYYFTNSLGEWHVDLNAVRTLELSAKTLPGLPITDFSDSQYGPSKWVDDLVFGWDNGNTFASAAAHYSSAYRVLQPFSSFPTIYNNYIPNPNPRVRSASYTTMDFQVGYRWTKPHSWLTGSIIRLGVQDAFDRAFPFVDTGGVGFVSNRVNVRGRVIYLDLKKEF